VFDGFRGEQSQPLRLFTPVIAVLAQIGDNAALFGDQSIGFRIGFRSITFERFRPETVTVRLDIAVQLSRIYRPRGILVSCLPRVSRS
jgi:hypothetical protein